MSEATLSTAPATLFDRIGGMAAVNAAVDIFYSKVMLDDRINHFFFHIDMEKQAGKLKAFLAYAFGAPLQYDGRALREAHKYMNLQEMHFNAVAEHLVTTLRELQVPEELVIEVVAIAMKTKSEVLNLS